MKNPEQIIVNELKGILNNPKIKITDLMEWTTDEKSALINLRGNEILVKLNSCDIYCAIEKSFDKRKNV